MGFFSSVAHVIAAPVTVLAPVAKAVVQAPINFGGGVLAAGKGVAAGDWQAAATGAIRAAVAPVNITTTENTANNAGVPVGSPTGYSAVANGSTDPGDLRKVLATTAAIGGAAVLGGALGGTDSAAAGAAASGSDSGVGLSDVAKYAPEVLGIGGAAAAAIGGSNKVQSTALRAPASVGTTQPISPALLALGAGIAFLIYKRFK